MNKQNDTIILNHDYSKSKSKLFHSSTLSRTRDSTHINQWHYPLYIQFLQYALNLRYILEFLLTSFKPLQVYFRLYRQKETMDGGYGGQILTS